MAFKTLIEFVMEKNLSKDEAERYIRSGKVYINDEQTIVPSVKVKETDRILVKGIKEWVSRGAYKLLAAKEIFNLDFNNKVVLDIGSSTGGFTQVALESGATKVYSLDVGTNQLDFKIRSNPKVVALEETNLKTINKAMFAEDLDLVVTDVSFISLGHVFNVLAPFNVEIVALIKPQFEAYQRDIEEGGYVDEKHHSDIINRVKEKAKENGYELVQIEKSPILGGKSKNIEYLSLFRKG